MITLGQPHHFTGFAHPYHNFTLLHVCAGAAGTEKSHLFSLFRVFVEFTFPTLNIRQFSLECE